MLGFYLGQMPLAGGPFSVFSPVVEPEVEGTARVALSDYTRFDVGLVDRVEVGLELMEVP